jgi:DNA ligase-1
MLIMMSFRIRILLTTLLFSQPIHQQVKAHAIVQSKPSIQLATTYKPIDDISQYWISEKLDGIRGYWNGQQLLTRQGNTIHSPTWFTKDWPKFAMDGELWIDRSHFQTTLSCVRKVTIEENCWRKVRFMIFDLPKHTGIFTQRVSVMKEITNQTASAHLSMIKQFRLKNSIQLERVLSNVIEKKGEGLMLHKGSAYYHLGRTANIMKLKRHQDAEAIVIAYIGGKGKYQGMLGALKVETESGIVFKLGSGFSDHDRTNPPKIGSIITYKYNGTTDAGIPRFARYFRIKNSH